MANHFRDHQVKYLRREDIARFALAWWSVTERRGAYFDICKFVLSTLASRLKSKGTLRIEFYDSEADLPDRACVTFDPSPTLHILRKIWDDAKLGIAYARFIIAHEVGHIVLHDRFAVGFSDDEAALLVFLEKEKSAENQANTFADLFLVPDHIALQYEDADVIATLCVVSDAVAKRRLKDARNCKSPLRPNYEGDMCSACSNFTLVRDGNCTKCDTCGSTSEWG